MEQTQSERNKRPRYGDGRVFARGRIFWISFCLRGKEIRESAGTDDRKTAERLLKRRIRETGADLIGAKPFTPPKQEKVTVNEILDDLVAHYERGGRKAIPREVTPQMRSHLKPLRELLGTRSAMLVGSRDVEAFISELKVRQRTNATINRSLQLLAQAFRHAVNSDPPRLNRILKIELLDETGNTRKGKFSPAEAGQVAASLPPYMADVARFAYETGARAGEILALRWSYLDGDGINVPGAITKNGEDRSIALTEEIEEILDRRRSDARPGCDLIFHKSGQEIRDYRKGWYSACVTIGLGAFYCRDCRDAEGRYVSKLDAVKQCPRCRKKWEVPKYIGRIFHDFRRSAAHEMWKAGSSIEDCMEATGHLSPSMFLRYADLFSKEEKQARQRKVQARRRDMKKAQATNLLATPARTAVQ